MRFILFFLFISNVFSQTHYFMPMDENFNPNEIPEGVIIDRPKESSHYLKPKERDKILKKYFSQEITKFDLVEKDILYKAILHYKKDRLIEKYPFIKSVDYEKLKNDFK